MHSREILDQIDRIVALALLSTRQRLEEFFWDFSLSGCQAERRLQMPLSQGEIAQYVMTTRQHLSRLLRKLEDDGLVYRTNGWYLLDRSRLWHREHPSDTGSS